MNSPAILTQIRSISWRSLWHEPITPLALSLFGLMCLAPIASVLVPPMFHILVLSYIVWMCAAVAMNFLTFGRWWLTWLIGTLLWSLAWLVGCLWQISQLIIGN